MTDLLVDTDVFIDHLRGTRRLAPGGHGIAYSVVTRCELFSGTGTDEAEIHRLLAPFREISVDRAIAERAGRIRRETRTRTPDALIAATALQYDLFLMTRNVRDFEPIPDLRLLPPA